MEKPFAFLWLYYQSANPEPFQWFTNQSYWFQWKECVQSRNNTDKKEALTRTSRIARRLTWYILMKWIRHGGEGFFFPFFFQYLKQNLLFSWQNNKNNNSIGNHAAIFHIAKKIPADACWVVLGWLQGTDTAFISASSPPRPNGFCWSQE